MAQLEKHKPNLIQEWLGSEEETIPAHPRGLEALETRVKIRKPLVPGKLRLLRPDPPAPKPEPALVREPAPPPKTEIRSSQATSREHLLKQARLPQLRAAYPRSRRPAARPAARRVRAIIRPAPRRAPAGRGPR